MGILDCIVVSLMIRFQACIQHCCIILCYPLAFFGRSLLNTLPFFYFNINNEGRLNREGTTLS